MDDVAKTNANIDAINRMARRARRLCNDIIRQTSLKPYYGKRGGAAMYAADDSSAEQRRRLASVVEDMTRATQTLVDIAIAGGLTEAQIEEINKHDYWRTKVTITDDTNEQ